MSTARSRRPETVVVGAGRLARAIVPALLASGWPVARIVVRSRRAARRMRSAAPGVPCVDRAGFGDRALVLLAVPDRCVAQVAVDLRAQHAGFAGIALHFAGSIGPDAASALGGESGAGVLHPLLSLGDAGDRSLAGGRARIEGGHRALASARRIARALGLRPLRTTAVFDDGARTTYHAAAAIAPSDLVALLSLAIDRMVVAGIERDDALDGVVRLSRGVLERIAALGPEAALTGPVVRGDADTVARHMDALGVPGAPDREIHRLLSIRLLALSGRAPDAPDGAAMTALRRVLRGGRSGVPDV